MKAMVIGANNFIGLHLVHYLENELHQEVTSVAVSAVGEHAPPGSVFVDFSQIPAIQTMLETYQPECLYCLLAVDSIAYGWEQPKAVIQIHVNYMLNILEAVKAYQSKMPVVIIGSGEEYGHVGFDRLPIKENQNPNPKNVYAVTKTCQTMMARLYFKAYQMHIIVARIFNAVGPYQPKRFVVPDFCMQVARSEAGLQDDVITVGNLNIQRDFVDVRDVVHALYLLSDKGRPGEIYNVGSGKAYSIRQVLDLILSQSSLSPRIERRAEKMRPIDVPILRADCGKCASETGWRRRYSLDKTIQDMLAEARGEVARRQAPPCT